MTLTALAKASIINTEAKLRIGSKEWVGVYSAQEPVEKRPYFYEVVYDFLETSFYKPITPGGSSKSKTYFL